MASTPASVTSTAWQLDPSHLEIGFAVRHLMISTVKGRFSAGSARVTTEGDDFATAKIEVSIPVSSIDTREPKRDAHLRSADFFDAERFPAITFKSRRVMPLGKAHYQLVGDLTIRDVTREVTLDVHTQGFVRDPWGNERAGFSADGVINRRDYGLTWNMALETGGVMVGDEVQLTFDLELTKQRAAA